MGVGFHHSHSIHHSYTLAHSAKNGVLAVKPLGRCEGHKELAAVGVRPCVGHCENSGPSEFQVWMKFVFKLFAIDGCTTSTCARWITPLDHEVLDDSVELGAIVVTSTSQLSKVLAGLWSMLPVQLQHNDAHAGLQVNVGRLPGVWGNRRHGEAGGILLYQRLLPVPFRGGPDTLVHTSGRRRPTRLIPGFGEQGRGKGRTLPGPEAGMRGKTRPVQGRQKVQVLLKVGAKGRYLANLPAI